MTFTLTRDHLDSLLGPTKEGNLGPFLDALDPDIEWCSESGDKHSMGPATHQRESPPFDVVSPPAPAPAC